MKEIGALSHPHYKGEVVRHISQEFNIELEIFRSILAPSDLQPHYGNVFLGNVYLLALDNTKR
jgi:hypothetical protein